MAQKRTDKKPASPPSKSAGSSKPRQPAEGSGRRPGTDPPTG
jgi:hypothetical protein